MKEKSELTNLELYYDDTSGYPGYYLKAEYLRENDKGLYKGTIPRIALPVNLDSIRICQDHPNCGHYGYYINTTIDLGFGKLLIMRDPRENYTHKEELIEEKIHDLTLEEIEKKLGYKVRIVNGK